MRHRSQLNVEIGSLLGYFAELGRRDAFAEEGWRRNLNSRHRPRGNRKGKAAIHVTLCRGKNQARSFFVSGAGGEKCNDGALVSGVSYHALQRYLTRVPAPCKRHRTPEDHSEEQLHGDMMPVLGRGSTPLELGSNRAQAVTSADARACAIFDK